jgi:hypothetical protein
MSAPMGFGQPPRDSRALRVHPRMTGVLWVGAKMEAILCKCY